VGGSPAAPSTGPGVGAGAGGGFGPYGLYTLSLLGSTDVTTHITSLNPVRLADFGHADLFQARDAHTLVWQAILDWVRGH